MVVVSNTFLNNTCYLEENPRIIVRNFSKIDFVYKTKYLALLTIVFV